MSGTHIEQGWPLQLDGQVKQAVSTTVCIGDVIDEVYCTYRPGAVQHDCHQDRNWHAW